MAQARISGRRRWRRPASDSAATSDRERRAAPEAEHGPVRGRHMPQAAASRSAVKSDHRRARSPCRRGPRTPAANSDEVGRAPAAAADDRADRDRARALAGRQRLEVGADLVVLRARARVAVGSAVPGAASAGAGGAPRSACAPGGYGVPTRASIVDGGAQRARARPRGRRPRRSPARRRSAGRRRPRPRRPLPASMPPMANHGTSPARGRGVARRSRARRPGRPGLVGVACTGPTAM